MQDFTMEGSAYWSDMAETLEDFLNVENVTEETALEFIRRFNLNGSKNGKPVTHTWWLDDFNKPIIQTIWDTQAADIVSNEKAFKNQRVPKYSKSTIYSDGTEVLIKKSEAIYGVKKRTNEEVSNENKRIQQKIIDAESYIFENKNDQYTEERANQIQQDTRDGEKARYKNLFVLNNVKGVLTIINGKYVEGGSVSRYDFEAAVFAELGKIIALGEKGGYKPLLTEEEWNEFITEAKEKNPDFIPPSKIQNKEIEGIRNITNPVNFWAYTKPVLVFRVPGIWDKLIENAKQQYYVDLDEATNIAGDYDVETVLDLQQLIDEYEEISELKEILKIENDDAIYIKVSDEVYRLMGEKIQHVNSETFTQDFRNEARELFWKDIKKIVGTPKKFKVWLQKTDKNGITNAQKLYEVMPLAVMNTSYTEFTDLIEERMNTDRSEKSLEVLVKNKYAGNDLRRKKEYTPEIEEQWINKIAPEVRPTTTLFPFF